ncbi:LpqT protein [Mycolicibacterium conceptionense]|nr:LpqT protein [Mycolicibacterium conceptionense]
MQSYNRVVIADDGLQPPQRYLVQLTVTTYADEAAAQGPDIESIIAGFNVAKK